MMEKETGHLCPALDCNAKEHDIDIEGYKRVGAICVSPGFWCQVSPFTLLLLVRSSIVNFCNFIQMHHSCLAPEYMWCSTQNNEKQIKAPATTIRNRGKEMRTRIAKVCGQSDMLQLFLPPKCFLCTHNKTQQLRTYCHTICICRAILHSASQSME